MQILNQLWQTVIQNQPKKAKSGRHIMTKICELHVCQADSKRFASVKLITPSIYFLNSNYGCSVRTKERGDKLDDISIYIFFVRTVLSITVKTISNSAVKFLKIVSTAR